MAQLKERLRSDLTKSIKGRQALRSSTLRMVLTAISTAEVAGKTARELSDAEVLDVLSAEAKKRRQSAEAFDAGNRPELADKEREEAKILAVYLPEPMSAQEVASIVAAAVEESGTAGQGMKAMGKVMGMVSPKVRGRAEGGSVAAEVKRHLGA